MGLVLALSFTICAGAQTDVQTGPASGGRILLVLPFDNGTGQPSLEWIREASAEIVSSRLASAGFAPMSRADRIYALDHLGLPQGFHPSRASSIMLAETLDADSIIVGSYQTDGANIVVEARLREVRSGLGGEGNFPTGSNRWRGLISARQVSGRNQLMVAIRVQPSPVASTYGGKCALSDGGAKSFGWRARYCEF